MKNKMVADIFNEIAAMLSIEETPSSRFEVNAYQKAALTISTMQEPIEDIYAKGGKEALMKLPGVGKGLAERIEEYLLTGKIKKYEDLKKRYPIDFKSLLEIEGMGAKKIVTLYRSLGVKNIEDLKKAIADHKIRDLPRFGEKSEEQLKAGIELLNSSKGRMLLGEALPVAESIVKKILESGLVEKAIISGSTRRMRETIGDIDILALSNNGIKVMDYFSALDDVDRLLVKGDTKTTVWLKIGTSCDLRVIEPQSFGAALQYFTGSKQHNIKVRKIAIKKGYKLNEYGLFDKKGKIIPVSGEESIYEKLGMQYMPPEMREDRGEVELALEHKIPRLVELGDIRGDLHTHTKETDGANTIEEMAEAAIALKREYIATTNHTKSLKVARGMDEQQFREFFKKVDRLNDKLEGKIRILKGAEMDILKDGSLDLDKSLLKEMDCVLGAVHSSFNMSEEEMTNRIIKALDTGCINILAHPTGRLINGRDAYPLNLEKVLEAAERNGVAMEINSFPNRLDLNDTNIMLASKYKIRFSIGTDSHRTSHLQFMRYGVGTARRGWLQKEKVINALPLEKLLKELSR
ncbi:MAG: DNA polymerase/3'-5' exonuclease PolX [Candidatus Micrarchaeaceae archaeon]